MAKSKHDTQVECLHCVPIKQSLQTRYDELGTLQKRYTQLDAHDRQLSEQLDAARGKNRQLSEQLDAARGKNRQLSEQLDAERGKNRQLSERLNAERGKNRQLSERLNAERNKSATQFARLYSSTSWRLTAPLRAVAQGAGSMRSGWLRNIAKRIKAKLRG